MKEIFVPRNFKTKTLARIEQANAAGKLRRSRQRIRAALAKAARRHDQTSADIVRKLLADYLRSEGLWK